MLIGDLLRAYFIFFICWLVILFLFEQFLFIVKTKWLSLINKNQIVYMESNDIPKLVKSIRFEIFLENIFLLITPYSLYLGGDYKSNDLNLLIRKKNKFLEIMDYMLYRLSPFRITNLIFIILFFQCKGVDIIPHLKNAYKWGLENLTSLKSMLLLVPATIALILIIISFFFTRRKGLLMRAKNKIQLENFEAVIRFHKKNRMFLNEISIVGYENINFAFRYRKKLITTFKKGDEEAFNNICNELYRFLKNIPDIGDLDNFITENDEDRDLYPFVSIGIKHVAFYKLEEIYNNINNPRNRLNKLNGIFCTKSAVRNTIENSVKYNLLEKNFDAYLIKTLKRAIIIQKYLEIIHPQFRRVNWFYSILAFITNKDK